MRARMSGRSWVRMAGHIVFEYAASGRADLKAMLAT